MRAASLPAKTEPSNSPAETPDALRDLSGHRTVLIICGAESMIPSIVSVMQELLRTHDSGIYITVNQPYPVLQRILAEKGVDCARMFFIDCITMAASGRAERQERCLYLPSPSHLTELSVGAMQALAAIPGDRKFVFMDSLGTFLIYNSAGNLSKFSHFLITKLSLAGVDGIFMSIEEEMDDKLKAELQSFCQKTIRLR